MLKLANQVLDAYDDIVVSKEGLKKIASENPNIKIMSFSEKEALTDDMFALSVITKKASKLNKFPINDFDNTFLSNKFFEMSFQRLPKVAAEKAAYFIKTACDRFGVEPESSVKSMAKEASSNVYVEADGALRAIPQGFSTGLEKFAEVDKISDNYTHAQYVMSTPSAVKIACEYFEKTAKKMPVEKRNKYASAIQKRAHELGMPVQKGMVSKYASDYYSPQIDAHILARKTLIQDLKPEAAENFMKLGSAKTQLTPKQFARALHTLDKKAGIDRYYGAGITDPFMASFAEEPDPYEGYRVKVAGLVMNSGDIETLANSKYDKIKQYFGSSIADEFKKNPVPIFESLPNDSKEILAGIANGTA